MNKFPECVDFFFKNVIVGPQDVLLFQVNGNKLVVSGANGLNIQRKLRGCQISIYNQINWPLVLSRTFGYNKCYDLYLKK